LKQNPSREIVPMLLQIASGLNYLHGSEVEIIHGDLKAENVFVDEDGTLRIGDFGLSRMLCNQSLWVTAATHAAGTVRWMSPELINGSSATSTKESDVYAFGMTAVEIFTGQHPFPSCSNDGQVLMAVVIEKRGPERPTGIEDSLWSFVKDCCSFDPSHRPASGDIVERLTRSVSSITTSFVDLL